MLNLCSRLSFSILLIAQFITLSASANIDQLAGLLRNGDIVFIQSKTPRSSALGEVMKKRGELKPYPWTHVGMAFKFPVGERSKIVEFSDEGEWMVAESVGPVKLTPLSSFIKNLNYDVKRLKSGVNFEQANKLFEVGKKHIKKTYDFYYLDPVRYCSGYVVTTYKDALSIELATPTLISTMPMEGKSTAAVLKEMFPASNEKTSKSKAPMTFEEWKTKTTITPRALYDSPLIETVLN